MSMVAYQLYASGSATVANLTTTNKGKIVGAAWGTCGTGGAGIGHNAVAGTINFTPTTAGAVQINGPQKAQNILIGPCASGNAVLFNEHDILEGLSIDYIPGTVFSLLNSNLGGTSPATWYSWLTLYALE